MVILIHTQAQEAHRHPGPTITLITQLCVTVEVGNAGTVAVSPSGHVTKSIGHSQGRAATAADTVVIVEHSSAGTMRPVTIGPPGLTVLVMIGPPGLAETQVGHRPHSATLWISTTAVQWLGDVTVVVFGGVGVLAAGSPGEQVDSGRTQAWRRHLKREVEVVVEVVVGLTQCKGPPFGKARALRRRICQPFVCRGDAVGKCTRF